MYPAKSGIAVVCAALLLSPGGLPAADFLSRVSAPYQARPAAPVNRRDSGRLEALMRAGNIYLSLQDAIALALENNLDIEVQRYDSQIADANLLHAQAGGYAAPAIVGVMPGAASVTSEVMRRSIAGVSARGRRGVCIGFSPRVR